MALHAVKLDMAIVDLFSKRRKKAAGKSVDVYQYEEIPDVLRVQVVHIWRDVLGNLAQMEEEPVFTVARNILCREYGWFKLYETRCRTAFEEVAKFFLEKADTDQALDIIELSFGLIENAYSKNEYIFYLARMTKDAGIKELNARFRENGVGYQYESSHVIRVDSTLIHTEVVLPALAFLSDAVYKGANDEFLAAHKYYRAGNFEACLNECLKAFESTLKIIIKKRRWSHSNTDTAKRLIEVVFAKHLVPAFMQSHFNALQSSLEAGVPTVRNKLGGHGKGDEAREVPAHFAAYALHLTATNIVFLVESERAL